MITSEHFKQFSITLNGEEARAFIVPNVPFHDKDEYIRRSYINATKETSYVNMYARWVAAIRPELRRGRPPLLKGAVQAWFAICDTKGRKYNAVGLGSLIQVLEGVVVKEIAQLENISINYFNNVGVGCLIAIFREIGNDLVTSELNAFHLKHSDLIAITELESFKDIIQRLKQLEGPNDTYE